MAGGFEGGAISSIRGNHGMIRSRGKAFVKYQMSINVTGDTFEVDQDHMDQLAKDAKQSAIIKLVLFILAICVIIVMYSLISQ